MQAFGPDEEMTALAEIMRTDGCTDALVDRFLIAYEHESRAARGNGEHIDRFRAALIERLGRCLCRWLVCRVIATIEPPRNEDRTGKVWIEFR